MKTKEGQGPENVPVIINSKHDGIKAILTYVSTIKTDEIPHELFHLVKHQVSLRITTNYVRTVTTNQTMLYMNYIVVLWNKKYQGQVNVIIRLDPRIM